MNTIRNKKVKASRNRNQNAQHVAKPAQVKSQDELKRHLLTIQASLQNNQSDVNTSQVPNRDDINKTLIEIQKEIREHQNWLNKFVNFYNNQAQILKQKLNCIRTTNKIT